MTAGVALCGGLALLFLLACGLDIL